VQHTERQHTFGVGREHCGNGRRDLVACHLDAGVRDHDRATLAVIERSGAVDHRHQQVPTETLALGGVELLPGPGRVHDDQPATSAIA
jgi:hypothetical protein